MSALMTFDLLRELIAATPMPPEGADADALLAAFDTMFEARQHLLLQITARLVDSDENRALVRELAVRDAAWEQALTAARAAVGAARSGNKALRSYAR
jgi:hypothetical protein